MHQQLQVSTNFENVIAAALKRTTSKNQLFVNFYKFYIVTKYQKNEKCICFNEPYKTSIQYSDWLEFRRKKNWKTKIIITLQENHQIHIPVHPKPESNCVICSGTSSCSKHIYLHFEGHAHFFIHQIIRNITSML